MELQPDSDRWRVIAINRHQAHLFYKLYGDAVDIFIRPKKVGGEMVRYKPPTYDHDRTGYLGI